MNNPTVLVATWNDGLFVVTGEMREHEFAGRSVRALTCDGQGGALAIIDRYALRRRACDGKWMSIVRSDFELSCAVAVGDAIYVGTDDARVLRVSADGATERLRGFDSVAGRDTWYAGSAIINGQRVGPPLGVRSIAANSDGSVLLANVHVGGIPRSTDGGVTWQPTIDIDSDVHEVCAHETRPEILVAAAAIGLCISRDAGATWNILRDGLPATYCSAVAFSGDEILVSVSADHFATEGAIYCRSIDSDGPLMPVGAGLPGSIDGIADTGCIATRAAAQAVADKAGDLYLSAGAGQNWSRLANGLPTPSSVLIV